MLKSIAEMDAGIHDLRDVHGVHEVQISLIEKREQPVLRQLIDLYAYDFSELIGLDVGEDGRFEYHDLAPYWTDAWRHPFFVRVEGKLAGFVLVHDRSRLSGADGIHDMAEFFILRKYRRRGLGARAAGQIFDRFPGPWEIRARSTNPAAVTFWRRVVDRYTGGRSREVSWDDTVWQGPVQLFTSDGRSEN
jgi:predicted acetyltransferase